MYRDARRRKERILEQQHIDFLVAEETLKKWAGLTLKERSKLFHRKFTNKLIAPMSLWRLYKRHGVKRKAVRKAKQLPDGGEPRWRQQMIQAREGVRQAIKDKAKLIYIDEIVFSKSSMQTHDFSPCY